MSGGVVERVEVDGMEVESSRGRFPNMPESALPADLLVGTNSDSSCFSLSRDLQHARG